MNSTKISGDLNSDESLATAYFRLCVGHWIVKVGISISSDSHSSAEFLSIIWEQQVTDCAWYKCAYYCCHDRYVSRIKSIP